MIKRIPIICVFVFLFLQNNCKSQTSSHFQQNKEVNNKITDQPKPVMIAIEGGSFTMGSYYDPGGNNSKPPHTVTLSSFSMGKYEVTVAEYKAFCTAAGGKMAWSPWEANDNYPILDVGYSDADAYCNWLSETTGKNYRLPTEAEWEYAAKGGQKSRGYTYSGSNVLDEVGWYEDNSKQIQEVGRKKPNELGLYDMSGNAWEWCQDWYGKYTAEAQDNPRGPAGSGKYAERVFRGGCWFYPASSCGVVIRSKTEEATDATVHRFGFRVVLPGSPETAKPKRCSDERSFDKGYSWAAHSGGWLRLTDCDYLFKKVQNYDTAPLGTLSHDCFCQGVEVYLNQNR